jgi:hypothetical protein
MSILELIENEGVGVLSTMSSIHSMFPLSQNSNNKGKIKQGKKTKNEKMNNLGP